MDIVKSLAQALDSNNKELAESLYERLRENYERTGFKPLVPPFRYWIIIAKMPKASQVLTLGGDTEEREALYLSI